jgi:hypothetical protein
MINKKFEDITLADIQLLIDMGVAESKTIEYKRDIPVSGDKGSVGLLREITAFANTSGGDLIYGMDAKDGIPVEAIGCESGIDEHFRLRIENLCRDGVKPKLVSPRIAFLRLEGDPSRVVIIIRVELSWSGPHRVDAGGHTQFYGRNSAGCFQMDVDDLRQAFLGQSHIAERIKLFRDERVKSIFNNTGPHPLMSDGGKLVVHVIPIASFSRFTPIDLRALRTIHPHLMLVGTASFSSTSPSLEGLVTSGHVHGGQEPEYITSIYRNGIIEGIAMVPVLTYRDRGRRFIPSSINNDIESFVERSVTLLSGLEVPMPYLVGISLVDISGYELIYQVDHQQVPSPAIKDRACVNIDDCWVDDVDEINNTLENAFQIMWNAFGVDKPLP